jgi:signal recognition particle subunit SRP14
VKLSTIVDVGALDAFYARYADVCKAGMTALKPRDRSKKKAKAKKKKGGAAGGPA